MYFIFNIKFMRIMDPSHFKQRDMDPGDQEYISITFGGRSNCYRLLKVSSFLRDFQYRFAVIYETLSTFLWIRILHVKIKDDFTLNIALIR